MKNWMQNIVSRVFRTFRSTSGYSRYNTDSVANMIPRLSALNGSTLRHAYTYAGHCLYGLIAVGHPEGTAEIALHGTNFTNLPDEVHEVSFHRITAQNVNAVNEIAEIKRATNITDMRYDNTILVRCREGEFYVSASSITYPPYSESSVDGFYKLTYEGTPLQTYFRHVK